MKIKRMINGIEHEFELTPHEMYDAFREQQKNFYREDVESFKEQFLDCHDNITEEQIDEAMDDIIEKYDDIVSEQDWWVFAEAAYEWVLLMG